MADASIVFRNEDMSSTVKIYVDTMKGAAELAARFRNASYRVDVIDGFDEVVHRWEKGKPNWENSDVVYFHKGIDPYDFVRKGDGFWDQENRLTELSEMLAYCFDIAVGHKDRHQDFSYLNLTFDPDWSLEEMIDEAETIKDTAPTDNAESWRDHMLKWIQDPQKRYLKYRVEYAALLIKTGVRLHSCRVPRLEVELAEIDVNYRISFQMKMH